MLLFSLKNLPVPIRKQLLKLVLQLMLLFSQLLKLVLQLMLLFSLKNLPVPIRKQLLGLVLQNGQAL